MHLGGITLDEPLPTRFTSGETYWVSGVAGVGVSALTLEFGSDRDNDHSFAAATGYRATMDTRLDVEITAVLDENTVADSLPGASPELEQNYPNPFNSSTTWRYTLNSAATPSLSIYAANGQRVRTIVLRGRDVGRHTIHWDGTDDDGHSLATGVYIARLQAGEAVVTRKLTLVRLSVASIGDRSVRPPDSRGE